ncbi:MAG: exodeoxyribonuclease VII large subunit [Vicinamibacterales bacterium]
MTDLFDLPFEYEDEPEPVPLARDRRQVYSVSQLTSAIRDLVESRVGYVWVEGEISNYRQWGGHVYFTLKDQAAQIKAVMFRTALRRLRFKPEDGLRVVASGRVTVYEPKGEYQIVCEQIEPHGLGALQLAFEQLKKRLEAEGLFEASRKRKLPALPRRIGVVTSLDGAAIRDILNVLWRRHPSAHVVIRPSRVQGEGASADLAKALADIVEVPRVDVVIVGRGGGSIEDLWAFNEEVLARAIAASPVPVISAVGHETDVTISDFVADVRAPTPSAAAEIVLAERADFCARIDRLEERSRAAALGVVHRARSRVHSMTARPGMAGWKARLAMRGRRADELKHDLERAVRWVLQRCGRQVQALGSRLEAVGVRRRLERFRHRHAAASGALAAAIGRARYKADRRFGALAARLESLSPLAVLGRGYAVCWNADRTAIVRQAYAVSPGEDVHVTLHEGELSCKVTGREKAQRPASDISEG